MKTLWSVARPLMACVGSTVALVTVIALMATTPGIDRHDTGLPMGVIIALVGMAASFGMTMSAAEDLRNQVPVDWLSKVGAEATLVALSNPIPRDAVDRRWLKQILDAVHAVPTYPMHVQFMDPIQIAKEQARRDSAIQLVIALIVAAQNARGVRLPPVVTTSDD